MRSNAFYRGVMGPVGSGKSSACCVEIMRRGQEQRPDTRGHRRTRWTVVRNTYRELLDTTIKTWQSWFNPEIFGLVKESTMTHAFSYDLPDKTTVDIEVLFRALDRPADVKKVLSLEITGAWVNEAREVPKGIIDGLGDRVGRYPTIKDGGCSWRGVMMDTNPPDDDHWWYRLAEVDRPEGWEFFKQPGGLLEVGGEFIENPAAENLANLEPGYYKTRAAGKTPGYIRIYYAGQYGFVQEGKPVIPEYVDALHCSQNELMPTKGWGPIYVGLDFGLTPAAVFAQRLPLGRWIWFDELVTEDMGAVRFAEVLKAKMLGEYFGFEFEIWGDPAGDQRSQTDEKTPFQILKAGGINARPAPSNDFSLRREAIAVALSRIIDGKPGLLISPKCSITRKGLAGGYHYRRMQIAGEERYQDQPFKNKYSHPVEAGGYLMMGAGEGKALVVGPKSKYNFNAVRISGGGAQSWM